MIVLKNDLLYDETKKVTDYKDCFQKAIKVKSWLRNKKVYAIAFNQVGLEDRCFVIRKPQKLKISYDIVINPQLLEPCKDAQDIIFAETCLSFPGKTFQMKRKTKIKVGFYNYNIKSEVTTTLEGMAAIVFQHEISHLDGLPDDVTCMTGDDNIT